MTDRPAARASFRARREPHREIEEEPAGAGGFEHRAVQAEQDDVRDRDVERHAVNPLERHVQVADEPRQVVAAMRDRAEADRAQPRSRQRVSDESHGDDRKNPPGRAPRGFEDHRDREDPGEHVAAGRARRAVQKRLAVGERPPQSQQRRDDPRGVDQRSPPPHRRLKAERRPDTDEQHQRTIGLRADDDEHPGQRESAEEQAEHVGPGETHARAILTREVRGPRPEVRRSLRATTFGDIRPLASCQRHCDRLAASPTSPPSSSRRSRTGRSTATR